MAAPVAPRQAVEDDPGLQRQLKWAFDDFEVIVADSRQAALAGLRRHEPPVVLQDLGLPPDPEGVSEGFTTLLEILKLAPHTKVIVVTGQLDRDNAVKAVGQGAYDFYQKPVDMDVLRLIVQRAYQIHDLEARNRELARELTSDVFLEVWTQAGLYRGDAKVSTWIFGIARFKGLEADFVVLCDVVPGEFTSRPTNLYVGGSRARHGLVVVRRAESEPGGSRR